MIVLKGEDYVFRWVMYSSKYKKKKKVRANAFTVINDEVSVYLECEYCKNADIARSFSDYPDTTLIAKLNVQEIRGIPPLEIIKAPNDISEAHCDIINFSLGDELELRKNLANIANLVFTSNWSELGIT